MPLGRLLTATALARARPARACRPLTVPATARAGPAATGLGARLQACVPGPRRLGLHWRLGRGGQ
eukprot:14523577-Alexandrium_andersonii.AAC.1